MNWHVASIILGSWLGFANLAFAQSCMDDKSATNALETCKLPQAEPPKIISGHCELRISGGEAGSCSRIQLLLRAPGGKNVKDRAAVIDGFNFKFTDLPESSYDIVLASPDFKLTSNLAFRSLKIGTTGLQIRIDAKPVK